MTEIIFVKNLQTKQQKCKRNGMNNLVLQKDEHLRDMTRFAIFCCQKCKNIVRKDINVHCLSYDRLFLKLTTGLIYQIC